MAQNEREPVATKIKRFANPILRVGAALGVLTAGALGPDLPLVQAVHSGKATAVAAGTARATENAASPELTRRFTDYEVVKVGTGSDGSTLSLVTITEPDGQTKSQYVADLTVRNGEIVLLAKGNERLRIWGVDAVSLPNSKSKVAVGLLGRPFQYVGAMQIDQQVVLLNQFNSAQAVNAVQSTPDGRKLVVSGWATDTLGYVLFDLQTMQSSRLTVNGAKVGLMQTNWAQINTDTIRSWGIPSAGLGITEIILQGHNLSMINHYPEIGDISRIRAFTDRNGLERVLGINNWRLGTLLVNDHGFPVATIYDPVIGKKTEMSSKLFPGDSVYGGMFANDVAVDVPENKGYVALVEYDGSTGPPHNTNAFSSIIARYDLNDPENYLKQIALITRGAWMRQQGGQRIIVRNVNIGNFGGRKYVFAYLERSELVYDPEQQGSSDVIQEARIVRFDITNGAENAIGWETVPLVIEPARLFLPAVVKKAA